MNAETSHRPNREPSWGARQPAGTPMWAGLLLATMLLAALAGCPAPAPSTSDPAAPDVGSPPHKESFHIHPGDDIQAVLDRAARQAPTTVTIHAGTYRPSRYAQCLVRFNREHDGIVLQAEGEVTLTAANPALSDPDDPAYPSVVNHVVYFGDGISSETVLRGVRITGANGFVGTDRELEPIEPDSSLPELQKNLFFYVDGGAIKIFGRSYPTIEDVEIAENHTRLCGGGVSIEHRGFSDQAASFRNCLFLNNTCPGTGSAIDVLGGSAVELDNCLFVGNIANTGMDEIADEFGLRYKPQHGCGALTVFPESRAIVRRCTFTENWNGVDDEGTASVYTDSIFWNNTAGDGSRPGDPYEMDVGRATQVRNCMIGGGQPDLQDTIDRQANNLSPPPPQFNSEFEPQAAEYEGVGYRRTSANAAAPQSEIPE